MEQTTLTGTGSFEFDAGQNETIRVLAGRMKFVGIFYIVLGTLIAVAGLFAVFTAPIVGVVYLLLTLLYVFIGFWTTQAAASFRMIVETVGSDIAHLNSALDSLKKLYTLQFWILIAAIGAFVFVFVVGLVIGIGAATS